MPLYFYRAKTLQQASCGVVSHLLAEYNYYPIGISQDLDFALFVCDEEIVTVSNRVISVGESASQALLNTWFKDKASLGPLEDPEIIWSEPNIHVINSDGVAEVSNFVMAPIQINSLIESVVSREASSIRVFRGWYRDSDGLTDAEKIRADNRRGDNLSTLMTSFRDTLNDWRLDDFIAPILSDRDPSPGDTVSSPFTIEFSLTDMLSLIDVSSITVSLAGTVLFNGALVSDPYAVSSWDDGFVGVSGSITTRNLARITFNIGPIISTSGAKNIVIIREDFAGNSATDNYVINVA